jgi:hypothetical protein
MKVHAKQTRLIVSRRVIIGLSAALLGFILTSPVQAEDLKGRWYFGGNLSFLSTTDSVRSNAQIIIGPLGDDGIPFTGDPNEEQGCTTQSAQSFCDPRPDDLLARETTIEETFKYDLTAGYGLTSWLSLQLDASYFKGNVGPVDTFLRDHFPISTNPADPTSLNVFKDRETVIPVQAGELTEMPVSLTAVIRFRKDSPLNPYVGVGAGMIFANLDRSSDVDELNARINDMRIRGVADEFNRDIVPIAFASLKADGNVPFRWPLVVSVDDAFEWHLTAGAEYFFNDKFSLVFDARYTFADQDVHMDLGGEDQIDLVIFSEKIFRPDGSLQVFAPMGVAPNTLCSDTNYEGLGCDPVQRPVSQRVNPQGKDPNTGTVRFTCPTVADFDKDGHVDQCYGTNVAPSTMGFTDPRGDLVVQGGKIGLTAFSIAVGMRFHW